LLFLCCGRAKIRSGAERNRVISLYQEGFMQLSADPSRMAWTFSFVELKSGSFHQNKKN
jgi:hypothetical protein